MSISLLANALSASGLASAGLELETPRTDAPTDDAPTSDSLATASVDRQTNLLVIPKPQREIGLDASYSVTSLALAGPERVFAAPSGVQPVSYGGASRPGFMPASFKALRMPGKTEDGPRFNFSLETQRAFPPQNAAAMDDQTRVDPEAPNLYLFVGADDEALVWGVAGKKRSGVALRDQLTVGNVQVGFAWATEFGRTSFGIVERRLKYNDRTGDHDVSVREHFAAISYSIKL